METAKIDIRKLQLLNDRINQTIDALNQVRLSVHGLSHTNATTNPVAALAMLGMAQNPLAALINATAQTQVAQNPLAALINAATQSNGLNQMTTNAPVNGNMSNGNPTNTNLNNNLGNGNLQANVNPLANLQTGLSHSTADSNDVAANLRTLDLAWLARISQTFPFACSPVPGSYNL